MKDHYDCQLTLVLPVELEDEVIDLLRSLPDAVSGYSLLPAEGFGATAELTTMLEQVRGKAAQRMVQVLLQQQQVETLLTALRAALPTPRIAWWVTPVLRCGSLA